MSRRDTTQSRNRPMYLALYHHTSHKKQKGNIMTHYIKLISKLTLTSLIFTSGSAMAASGVDEVYKNLTLEQRLYLYDGFGAKWAMDVGNDGLWFVPKRPLPDTYSASVKIRNSALENNLVIGSNNLGEEGFVGIGTDTPSARLDVNGSIQSSLNGPGTESVYRLLTLSANDTDGTGPSEAAFVLNNALYQKEWLFRTIDNGAAFTATLGGTGGAEFKVSSPTGQVSGTELYLGNGAKNVGGVWINASSRALKENIKPLSTKEALTAFSKLQPVTYNYKTDKSEQVVGFIAEDVPALVAINSRDGLSSMDMVAVLTKVVQEQEKILKIQAEKIANLEAMQKRLAKVESLLTNLALKTKKSTKEKISLK